jgi:SAM-dependent methyltransferase
VAAFEVSSHAEAKAREVAEFWSTHQPGLTVAGAEPGSEPFYRNVEEHRYRLEPHIAEVARFPDWTARDVLEAGCGIGTDGAQFARHGARYTGLDQSELALTLAERGFEVRGLHGRFVRGTLTALPFEDESFDLVYSYGVVHHSPQPEKAIAEFRRVLRQDGVAVVMLYHRGSLNYRFNILVIRRALAAALLIPRFAEFAARFTHENIATFSDHRRLLRRYGVRYLADKQLFLNSNTDGPGNPLSKVYSRQEACELFSDFSSVSTAVRYLNLRLYPGGERLARTDLARRLERAIGWHLSVRAIK